MKKYIIGFFLLFIYQFSIAQENRKSFDFIINVDAEIAKTLFKPVIIVKKNGNVLKKIEIGYYPGNLSLSTADYNMIFSEQETILFFQFDYYRNSVKGKQELYNYEIEMGKNWFEQSFVILKIYNLDKKKYRKRLEPLSKDRKYTFDLETSQGQMIRIRKNKK